MVLPIIAREAVRRGVQYIAQGLRYQDKLVTAAYSRPFLPQSFRREIVRGIKHGLAGGQVVGGLIFTSEFNDADELSVISEDEPVASRPFYKTRRRSAARFGGRCPTNVRSSKYRGRPRSRKY